jgi:Pectate lyase superfamily protein
MSGFAVQKRGRKQRRGEHDMTAIDKIRRTNIGLARELPAVGKALGPLRRALVALLFFGALAASCAHAQGSRKDDIVFGPDGHPIGNATIAVCQSTATGTPCSPLATIYTDATLSVPTQNPFQSDGIGNYHFYAPAGRYVIQISAPQISGTQTFPDTILPNDPSSTGVGNNISAFGLTLGGNLTVAGNANIAGTLTTTNFNPGSFTPSSLSVSGSGCFGGPRPSIDVTCPPYNAKGDAVTNDTAAIQAAITAACALEIGGVNVEPTISFPPGEYIVSQPQTPSTSPVFELPCNHLTFEGVGNSSGLSFIRSPAVRIVSLPGSNPNSAAVFDCRYPTCSSGVTFRNLDIAGYNKALWVYTTTDVVLQNVTLETPASTGMADNSALEITNTFWFEWHGGECAGIEAPNNYCILMTGDVPILAEAPLVGLAIFDNLQGYGGAFRYDQRVNTSGSGPGNLVFENIRGWEANHGPFLYITNSTGNPASASLPQFSGLTFNNVTTSDSTGYPAVVELNAAGTTLYGINISMSLAGNGGAPIIQNDNPSTSFIEGCHITGNESYFGAITVTDSSGNPAPGCSTQTFNGFDYAVGGFASPTDPRLRSDTYQFNGGQNGDALRATFNGNRFAGVAIDPVLGLLLNTGSDFGYGASVAQNSRGTLDIQFATSYPPTSVAGTATTGGSIASGTYYATMYSATGGSGNCNSDQSAPSIQTAGIALSGANNAIALTWILPVAGLSAIQGYCVAISTTPNLNNNLWVPNQTNNVFVLGAGTTSYTLTALPSTGGNDSLTSTLAPAHRFTPSSLGINNTNPQFNLDVNGSAAVNALNGVQKAERFTGADAAAQITACLAAAAVSTASSVCDARGMAGTLTGAHHITIPAGTVLLWGQGQLTITDTTTNDAVELTGDGASIKGYQESGTGTVAKPDTSGFIACGNAGCTTVKNPNQATSKINFVHIEGMALFATGANSKVIDMTSVGHSDIENNNLTLGTGGNSYGIYGNTSVGVFDGTNTLFKHNNMNPQSAGDTCFYLAGIYNAIVLEQNACILPPAASTGYVFAKDSNGNYPNNDEVYGNDCESSSAAFGQICYNIVGATSVTFGPNNRCEDIYNCIQFPSDGSAIGIHLLDPYLSITNTTQIKPNEPATAMVAIDNNGHNWTPSMHFGQNDLAGPNLLANAGFEAWSGGAALLAWGGASGTNINQAASGIYARQSSSSAPVDTYTQGIYNVKIGDGATAGLGVNSQCISVDPAAEYTFGVRVAAGSTSANFRPGFRFYYDSNCTEADKITNIATNARVLAPANYVDNGGNGGNWQSTNASLTYNNGITCNCNVTGGDWQVATANAWTVNRNYAVIFRVPNGYSVSSSVAHSMRIFLLENSASPTNYVYFDDAFLTKGPMPSEPRFAPLADSGNGGTDTVYSNLSVQGTVNGTSQNAASAGGQFLGAPSGTAPSLIAQLSASQTGHMLDLDPSSSSTPISFFDNSGNLVARNDLNAVSPLGAATVSMSNASDGVAIAPASGTTSGNALKVMAPGSSATVNASISYAGNVQGIFLLANRGSSIGPSNITLSSGWGSGASVTASGTSQRFTATVTASGTTAANPTIAINFTNTWPLTPIFICKMVGGTGAVANVTGENTATTGSMTITYNGTPASSSTYVFNCHGE